MALAGPWGSDRGPRAEHQHPPARALSHRSLATLSCLSCPPPSTDPPVSLRTGRNCQRWFPSQCLCCHCPPCPSHRPGSRGSSCTQPLPTALCPSLQLCSQPSPFLFVIRACVHAWSTGLSPDCHTELCRQPFLVLSVSQGFAESQSCPGWAQTASLSVHSVLCFFVLFWFSFFSIFIFISTCLQSILIIFLMGIGTCI